MLKTIHYILLVIFIANCSDSSNELKLIKHKNKIIKNKIIKIEKAKIIVKKKIVKKVILKTSSVKSLCLEIKKKYTKYHWKNFNCLDYQWKQLGTSVNNRPLIYTTYGKFDPSNKYQDVTILMCGVHGDEITPVKFCFDAISYIEKMNNLTVKDPISKKIISFKNKFVIIAPIVNPDSFLISRPTRYNANGIDVNRNMPTNDFVNDAVRLWINKYHKDKRRYPGKIASSEPETRFQVDLIKKFSPNKILSVHSPLSMLDYDGPSDFITGGEVGSSANQLLIKMSENAKDYKIKNYPFFPGSLGNYAGNERHIPTFTIELPSIDAHKSKRYWKLFKPSIYSAIMHGINTKKKDLIIEKTSGISKSSFFKRLK